ncbi:MAG: spike base protein, RCAP_Rcc01079 family [Shimia sp.]
MTSPIPSPKDPFAGRAAPLDGPAHDLVPVTPDDAATLPPATAALYVETGGTLAVETAAGAVRLVRVADFSILPVRARKVAATGTDAAGIFALVIA